MREKLAARTSGDSPNRRRAELGCKVHLHAVDGYAARRRVARKRQAARAWVVRQPHGDGMTRQVSAEDRRKTRKVRDERAAGVVQYAHDAHIVFLVISEERAHARREAGGAWPGQARCGNELVLVVREHGHGAAVGADGRTAARIGVQHETEAVRARG